MERLRCLSMSFHLQVSNADVVVDDNNVHAGDDGDGDGDDDGVFPIIDYAGGDAKNSIGGVQCKCCNVQVSHRMIVILN